MSRSAVHSGVRRCAFITLVLLSINQAFAAEVPEWPDLYDPFTVLNFHVETLDPADFEIIRNDTTYDVEVPAWFWAEGEAPILVSIRRKSASAIPNELDPFKKVSYKIDINEYHDDPDGVDICQNVPGVTEGCVSTWKGVKKLSLENGDDQNVVDEGVAWYLHRLAADSGLDYYPGLASWTNLTINGELQGVYVNVEQRDKQFLKNRGLWEVDGDTWLYKMSIQYEPEFKEGPETDLGEPIDSPTVTELCFTPFLDADTCPTPNNFKEILNTRINMEGMLTLGAVSAFHNSPDDLFAKGKNFYYADQGNGLNVKREYFQWDLDSAFGSKDPNINMYRTGRGKHNQYEKALVGSDDSPFREEYDEIVRHLVGGDFPVFEPVALATDLMILEAVLSASLAADPNSKDAGGSFATLQEFFIQRTASMQSQLPAGPPPPASENDIHVGDLEGVAASAGRRQWTATVTITIHDHLHGQSVDEATVIASWSGGVPGDTACVTDASGQCKLQALITSNKTKKVNVSISGVNRQGSVYVPAQNHDLNGNSDGNTISISRP